MFSKRVLPLFLCAVALVLVLVASAQSAGKSSKAMIGIFDEGQTLYGNPDYSFGVLSDLNAQLVRSHMYWGGRFGVANRKPAKATNPNDPAYNWSLYQREVDYATQNGIKVVFSIYGTPSWANGGKGANAAPKNFADLQSFATAAAKKFPQVKYWLAWNEPNNPVFLKPQYKRVKGKWVAQAAIDYAKICNAIYAGVKAAKVSGQKVACGVTAPGGNNRPAGSRPSIAPITFLRAVKKAGLKKFDAWAHHPYPSKPSETPTSKPPKGSIRLGNINVLLNELGKLYGRSKHLWITEYGYQTKPEDPNFGVTWAQQAQYLQQAWAIIRANPRIDMMIWFIFQDDTNIPIGWQSGLLTYDGIKKPSYSVFQSLPHA
jgi:hypothetical protein